MRNSSQNYGKGGEWKGIALLILLVFLSVLNINVAGQTISFVFLPLVAVCLWPRTDKVIVSIIAIFLLGLLLDLLSAGPLGLWTLIFLAVFGVSRPHMRLRPHTFSSALMQWLFVLVFAFVASYLLGWFAQSSRPDIIVLVYQSIAALLLFPLVYGIRHLGRYVLSDPDLRGL